MKLKYYILIILLFFGTNVLYNIGYPYARGGDLTKIEPSVFLSILYILSLLLTNNKQIFIGDKKIYLKYLLILVCFFVFNNLLGNGGGMIIINTFILTVLFALIYDRSDELILYKIIRVFYILTCITAIFEVMVGKHLFDLDPVIYEIDNCYNPIRATCFQGHALSNCLIIDIIMLFIAFSSIKILPKMFYLLLGLLAVLAFGSRSSLLLWGLLIPIILIFYISQKKYKTTTKIKAFILLLILSSIVFYALTNTQLGLRIMEHAEFDTSAEIRLRSLEAIYYMDMNELLWGFPPEKVKYLYDVINVNALENFYIIWVMKFGLVASVFITIMMFVLLFKSMKQYKILYKIAIISAFLLVASTNNSMGTGGIFLSVFYVCAISFQSKYKEYDTKNHSLLLVRKRSLTANC